MTPDEIIEQVLSRKRSSKVKAIAEQKKRSCGRDPWHSSKGATIAWYMLYEIYEWSRKHNALAPQAYRQLADDLYVFEKEKKTSWMRALRWVNENGNPRMNESWNKWYALHATEES